MASIHIGIGHDDHFMVPEFDKIQCFGIFHRAYRNTQGSIHIPDFFIFIDPVFHGFFHIQDLTPQRQDGLKTPVTALFCGSARRISFHQV